MTTMHLDCEVFEERAGSSRIRARARSAGSARLLTADECSALLATDSIGRIVHTDGALPAVTPVSYRLSGGQLILRVPAPSAFAESLPGTIVAMSVDHFDRVSYLGWTVLILGEATPCAMGPRSATPGRSVASSVSTRGHQLFTLARPLIMGERHALQ